MEWGMEDISDGMNMRSDGWKDLKTLDLGYPDPDRDPDLRIRSAFRPQKGVF